MKRMISFLLQKNRKRHLKACGNNVRIARGCHLCGSISVGSHVVVGQGAWFVSTRAEIYIHDHVIFGPHVMIYTGDHPTNVVGKHISELTDVDKDDPHLDQDVVIESGCWIGARAIILKGVIVGRGSVIGAGAVVTKDVPPYSVYVGIPHVKVRPRFNAQQIAEHEQLLQENGWCPDAFTK